MPFGPKAVVVTTSEFTRRARQLAARHLRIELIGKAELIRLMNEHLGANWPKHVDSIRLLKPEKGASFDVIQ